MFPGGGRTPSPRAPPTALGGMGRWWGQTAGTIGSDAMRKPFSRNCSKRMPLSSDERTVCVRGFSQRNQTVRVSPFRTERSTFAEPRVFPSTSVCEASPSTVRSRKARTASVGQKAGPVKPAAKSSLTVAMAPSPSSLRTTVFAVNDAPGGSIPPSKRTPRVFMSLAQ